MMRAWNSETQKIEIKMEKMDANGKKSVHSVLHTATTTATSNNNVNLKKKNPKWNEKKKSHTNTNRVKFARV